MASTPYQQHLPMPESLGAYVISQANTSSDVLAVIFLQKQFGMATV